MFHKADQSVSNNFGKNVLDDVSQGRSVSDALKHYGSDAPLTQKL